MFNIISTGEYKNWTF